jgi:hypothetical protein
MFLHWRSPEKIARSFKIGYRCVYRHAHATGLYELRRRNLRYVLEPILERSGDAPASAREIISAVRVYARINDDGNWVEPPTTNKIVVEHAPGPQKRPLASIQVEEAVRPASPLLPQGDGNGTQEMPPGKSDAPVSVLLASTESDENEIQPVNQSQTEIDLTH